MGPGYSRILLPQYLTLLMHSKAWGMKNSLLDVRDIILPTNSSAFSLFIPPFSSASSKSVESRTWALRRERNRTISSTEATPSGLCRAGDIGKLATPAVDYQGSIQWTTKHVYSGLPSKYTVDYQVRTVDYQASIWTIEEVYTYVCTYVQWATEEVYSGIYNVI